MDKNTQEESSETMAEELMALIRSQVRRIGSWVKPNPADNIIVKIVKLILKSVVVLVLIAFSPVILLILVITFLAAF